MLGWTNRVLSKPFSCPFITFFLTYFPFYFPLVQHLFYLKREAGTKSRQVWKKRYGKNTNENEQKRMNDRNIRGWNMFYHQFIIISFCVVFYDSRGWNVTGCAGFLHTHNIFGVENVWFGEKLLKKHQKYINYMKLQIFRHFLGSFFLHLISIFIFSFFQFFFLCLMF